MLTRKHQKIRLGSAKKKNMLRGQPMLNKRHQKSAWILQKKNMLPGQPMLNKRHQKIRLDFAKKICFVDSQCSPKDIKNSGWILQKKNMLRGQPMLTKRDQQIRLDFAKINMLRGQPRTGERLFGQMRPKLIVLIQMVRNDVGESQDKLCKRSMSDRP